MAAASEIADAIALADAQRAAAEAQLAAQPRAIATPLRRKAPTSPATVTQQRTRAPEAELDVALKKLVVLKAKCLPLPLSPPRPPPRHPPLLLHFRSPATPRAR